MSLLRRARGADRLAPPDVSGRLDALAGALDLGEERLDPALAAPAHALVRRAGERLALSSAHTVVALAGATGSGKSSLFNALAGLDLARTGVRRPTTAEPMACVWGPEGAGPLLEWLGVPQRHQVARESALDGDREAGLRGLVLLDLPDHDSTELAHRLQVDRLVEQVDLLVWVVDPQKYADAALHERYLRPLARHGAVLRVVLNQADRLSPADAGACAADLRRLLGEDGLEAPEVLVASARTGAGVAALREDLAAAVRGHAARVERVAADLDAVVPPLAGSLGGEPGEPGRRDDLVRALAAAAGVPVVADAVGAAVRHRAAATTGWPPTRWLRRLRPDPLRRLGLDRQGRSSLPAPAPASRARVDLAVRRTADAAAGSLAPPWAGGVRRAAAGGDGDLADALDRAVAGTDLGVARPPRWWRAVAVLQWLLLAVAAAGLGWLAALAAMAYLQLPEPSTPSLGALPWPTALLLGGVVAGLLLALGARLAARASARRASRRAVQRLEGAVAGVADRHVLEPVGAELARWREVRRLLERAGG
ncbi:GTPase [Vallicoccus soli]|uniref:ABC transporter n=1 Tax=Vallicoccus soli TaxID=2339232 RepID=A0A3A3Z588_9ACTN|nr:GTPase [Vallicoccus soli]RJK98133.1 ABC transporter [Vallicoccus soli]